VAEQNVTVCSGVL